MGFLSTLFGSSESYENNLITESLQLIDIKARIEFLETRVCDLEEIVGRLCNVANDPEQSETSLVCEMILGIFPRCTFTVDDIIQNLFGWSGETAFWSIKKKRYTAHNALKCLVKKDKIAQVTRGVWQRI